MHEVVTSNEQRSSLSWQLFDLQQEVQQGLSKWSSITYEEQLEVIEPKLGKERVDQDP